MSKHKTVMRVWYDPETNLLFLENEEIGTLEHSAFASYNLGMIIERLVDIGTL